MRLSVTTAVDGDFRQVFTGFDQQLFSALNPPFPKVKLLRFDGTRIDGEAHLELNFGIFRQRWISRNTDFEEGETEIFFVDVGVELPFFLKSWRHRHRVVAAAEGKSLIVDEIDFTGPNPVLSLLLLPALYLQFLYRKPIYKRFFGALARA